MGDRLSDFDPYPDLSAEEIAAFDAVDQTLSKKMNTTTPTQGKAQQSPQATPRRKRKLSVEDAPLTATRLRRSVNVTPRGAQAGFKFNASHNLRNSQTNKKPDPDLRVEGLTQSTVVARQTSSTPHPSASLLVSNRLTPSDNQFVPSSYRHGSHPLNPEPTIHSGTGATQHFAQEPPEHYSQSVHARQTQHSQGLQVHSSAPHPPILPTSATDTAPSVSADTRGIFLDTLSSMPLAKDRAKQPPLDSQPKFVAFAAQSGFSGDAKQASPKVTPTSVGEEDSGDFSDEDEDFDGRADVNTGGRLSNAKAELLNEGIEELTQLLKRVSKDTGLTVQQVLCHLMPRGSRRESTWNIYEAYILKHRKEELGRLSSQPIQSEPATVGWKSGKARGKGKGTGEKKDDEDDEVPIPMDLVQKCFAQFKKAYPGGKHIEILRTWRQADLLDSQSKITIANRVTLFHKFVAKLEEHIHQASLLYNIETAFVTAGGIILEDNIMHLGFSANAKDFFTDRLNVSTNNLLAHFKAHINNNLSLEQIPNRDAEDESNSTDSPLKTASPSKPRSTDEKITSQRMTRSTHVHTPVKTELASDESSLQSGADCSTLDALRNEFAALAHKHGLELWTKSKTKSGKESPRFAWGAMLRQLQQKGVNIYGWPDNVSFPTSRGKGILNLKAEERTSLLKAIRSGSLKFRKVSEGPIPEDQLLIHGEPPAAGSSDPLAKRRYMKKELRDGPSYSAVSDNNLVSQPTSVMNIDEEPDILSFSESDDDNTPSPRRPRQVQDLVASHLGDKKSLRAKSPTSAGDRETSHRTSALPSTPAQGIRESPFTPIGTRAGSMAELEVPTTAVPLPSAFGSVPAEEGTASVVPSSSQPSSKAGAEGALPLNASILFSASANGFSSAPAYAIPATPVQSNRNVENQVLPQITVQPVQPSGGEHQPQPLSANTFAGNPHAVPPHHASQPNGSTPSLQPHGIHTHPSMPNHAIGQGVCLTGQYQSQMAPTPHPQTSTANTMSNDGIGVNNPYTSSFPSHAAQHPTPISNAPATPFNGSASAPSGTGQDSAVTSASNVPAFSNFNGGAPTNAPALTFAAPVGGAPNNAPGQPGFNGVAPSNVPAQAFPNLNGGAPSNAPWHPGFNGGAPSNVPAQAFLNFIGGSNAPAQPFTASVGGAPNNAPGQSFNASVPGFNGGRASSDAPASASNTHGQPFNASVSGSNGGTPNTAPGQVLNASIASFNGCAPSSNAPAQPFHASVPGFNGTPFSNAPPQTFNAHPPAFNGGTPAVNGGAPTLNGAVHSTYHSAPQQQPHLQHGYQMLQHQPQQTMYQSTAQYLAQLQHTHNNAQYQPQQVELTHPSQQIQLNNQNQPQQYLQQYQTQQN